jgi:tRNA pseudouridine38-40 synthase
MRNLRLQIAYDGANYCGWQKQNRRKLLGVSRKYKDSIQGTVEKALRKILQQKIKLIGSGRTDAGVHALGQTANFHTRSKIPAAKIALALNALLPPDIRVLSAKDAPLDFHSRFCAKGKTYHYLVLNSACASPFWQGRAYFYSYPLNLARMRRAAAHLTGKHDFRAFCASQSGVKTTIRTIKKISLNAKRYTLYARDCRLITIEIEANGFLYKMARAIVGTLIEAGRGKIAPLQVKRILLSRDRRLCGPVAPGHGLYLVGAKY